MTLDKKTLKHILETENDMSVIHFGTGRERMKTRVKEYRQKKGITQQSLAELVHVTKRTIISIETGQYNPSLMLAYRLARVFGVSIEELCCLEENCREKDR